MDELYEHRYALWLALCRALSSHKLKPREIWRSSYHTDGSEYMGWFLLGIGKETGKQLSYHLPIKLWFDTGFAETLDRAPSFDGHTSADVLERIKNL